VHIHWHAETFVVSWLNTLKSVQILTIGHREEDTIIYNTVYNIQTQYVLVCTEFMPLIRKNRYKQLNLKLQQLSV
jgi:hypothetical protein